MADRAVGTATNYPVDKQHVGVEDRELARGHWAGTPGNTRVRPSTIKYGDPASAFWVDPNAVPPAPPATTIGTVTINGDTAVNTGDTKTYTASVSGDVGSGTLTYQWQNTGGNEVSSSGATYQVEWDTETTGNVTCQVTSSDPNCTDSPAISSPLEVDVVTVFSGLTTEGGDNLLDESGNPILPE